MQRKSIRQALAVFCVLTLMFVFAGLQLAFAQTEVQKNYIAAADEPVTDAAHTTGPPANVETGWRETTTGAVPMAAADAGSAAGVSENAAQPRGDLDDFYTFTGAYYYEDEDFNPQTINFAARCTDNAAAGFRMDDAFTLSVPGAPADTQTAKARISADKYNDTHLTYANAFGKNTSLRYSLSGAGVVMRVTLEKNTGENSLELLFSSDTHTPVLSADRGSLFIMENDNPGVMVYRIGGIYAYDSYKMPVPVTELPTATLPPTTTPPPYTDSYGTTRYIDTGRQVETTGAYTAMQEQQTYVSGYWDSVFPAETAAPQDTVKHYSDDGYFKLELLDSGDYLITAVLPAKFLNRGETIYPVMAEWCVNTTPPLRITKDLG